MNSPSPRPPGAGDRLKTREYIGYALGDTASNFFFQTFNIFLTYYYVDVWGIPATALLWMMPIVRLIGAFDDPIMGLIADRTNTRWGKFRPYLLWGAIPYGICGYLVFAGPDLSPTGRLVYAYITYALMLTSYTVINVPYSSLLGVISPSSRTRTVASSFRFVGAFAGALLISLFVRPLVKHLGGGNEMHGFQTSFFFLPKDSFGLQLALNAFAQFCAGPTSALTWALYGDVADYGEWKYGRRSMGLVYSASLFAIKTGMVVGGFLLPLFLDQFGFVRNAAQTTTALLGITLAFSIAPGFLALLKAGALMIYPLNQKRVDEIERELAARRASS
ncbi:MAG: MFS transporter [Verrucomicrobia bacterium]|nr:MFS transporter [Verrucomicrobiota bacterium]